MQYKIKSKGNGLIKIKLSISFIISHTFLPQPTLGSPLKPSGQVQNGFPMFSLSKYT